MSGGVAHVLDETGDLADRLNPLAAVDLEPPDADDGEHLQKMLRKHVQFSPSGRADDILRKWETFAPKFVKVYPQEYRAALETQANRAAEAD